MAKKLNNRMKLILLIISALGFLFGAYYFITPLKARISVDKKTYQVGEDIEFTISINKFGMEDGSVPPIIEKKVDGRFETITTSPFQCPGFSTHPPYPSKISFSPDKVTWDQKKIICINNMGYENLEYEAVEPGIYRAKVWLSFHPELGSFYSDEFEIVND